MEKIKFSIVVFGVATISLNLSMNRELTSADKEAFSITLENIEALASTEGSNPSCYYLGSIDCSTATIKVKYVQQ